jgi:hypothetical protein
VADGETRPQLGQTFNPAQSVPRIPFHGPWCVHSVCDLVRQRASDPNRRQRGCFAFCTATAMSGPSIPPEIWDYILDLLHGESETLRRCCLVSKSWVPRTRKHLFREILILFSADVDAWKEAFPDPVNSPACYTHPLTVGCEHVTAGVAAEEDGWIRAFYNVVQLRIFGGMRNLHLHPLPQLLSGLQLSPCSL